MVATSATTLVNETEKRLHEWQVVAVEKSLYAPERQMPRKNHKTNQKRNELRSAGKSSAGRSGLRTTCNRRGEPSTAVAGGERKNRHSATVEVIVLEVDVDQETPF